MALVFYDRGHGAPFFLKSWHQSLFAEAEKAVFPDDDVVVDEDIEHPGRILSRDQLIEMARGGEPDVFDRAIDVQISRLRRKLKSDDDRDVIRTYRGAGYLFDAKVQRP